MSSNKFEGLALVVDDEPDMRAVAKKMLEKKGFQVLVAENGKLALDFFINHRNELRLVLLDMTMPDMNGDEVLHSMRNIDSRVPIVLSSGYSEESFAGRYSKQEIAGFLQKPYRSANLYYLLGKIIKSSN